MQHMGTGVRFANTFSNTVPICPGEIASRLFMADCGRHGAYCRSILTYGRRARNLIVGVLFRGSAAVLRARHRFVVDQCDISVGIVIDSKMPCVTPPSTHSLSLECPYPPMTRRPMLLSAADDRMAL